MSPESSETGILPSATGGKSQIQIAMLPPTVPMNKKQEHSSLKTPRPDISMGIKLTSLTSALSSQGLNKIKARKFLVWMQNEMVMHEPDGLLEPMLIPIPAPRALDLAFPSAVVEGKAYSTGKQIFEAENQAAVSAACGLKIQLDLNDLVDHATETSGAHSTLSDAEPPLFFSVCTQGPIHELWAHWTVMEDETRVFQSKLVDSCNALLPSHGEEFLSKLHNVCAWGTGSFMESVVERLGKVARQARS